MAFRSKKTIKKSLHTINYEKNAKFYLGTNDYALLHRRLWWY